MFADNCIGFMFFSRLSEMHQPPTIPEGDEENEGAEQAGVATRLPPSNTTSQLSLSTHDTTTEVTRPHDESIGHHEQTSNVPEQRAVVNTAHSTSNEHVHIDSTSEKHDEQWHESSTSTSIKDDDTLHDQSGLVISENDRSLPTLAESPIPPAEESTLMSPRVMGSDHYLKPDELTNVR
jgi:hypothetical protein